MEERLRQLEASLEDAEIRAQQATSRAAATKEQLELAKYDKRALVAHTEQMVATERAARTQLRECESRHAADRKKLRDAEARLVVLEGECRSAKLRVDTLNTSLISAESEAKWFAEEMDRRASTSRTKARELSANYFELQHQVQTFVVERDSLRRQLLSAQQALAAARKELEDAQDTHTVPSKPAEETAVVVHGTQTNWERSMLALESELLATRAQEDSLRERFSAISRAYCESLEQTKALKAEAEARKDETRALQEKCEAAQQESEQHRQRAGRLGQQLRHLLINTDLAHNAEPLLSSEEKADLEKALATKAATESMQVVGERLVKFVDVAELLTLNEQLLRVVDSLSTKCEKYETNDKKYSEVMATANETIQQLNSALEGMQEQSAAKLLEDAPAHEAAHEAAPAPALPNSVQTHLELQISELERQLRAATDQSAADAQRIHILTQDLSDARDAAEKFRSQNALATSQRLLLQDQAEKLTAEFQAAETERLAQAQQAEELRGILSDKDRLLETTQTQLLAETETLRRQLLGSRHELTAVQDQAKLQAQQRDAARHDTETVRAQLVEAQHKCERLEFSITSLKRELAASDEKLRLRTLSFTTADSERVSTLESDLEQAHSQIKDLRSLAASTQKELDASAAARAAEAAATAKLQSELLASQQQYKQLQETPADTSERDAALAKLAAAESKSSALAAELAQLKTAADEAAAEHKAAATQLQQQLAALEAQRSELQATLNSSGAASRTEIASLQQQVAASQQDIARLNQQVEATMVENTQLQAKIETLLQAQAAEGAPSAEHEVVEMLRSDHQRAVMALEEEKSKSQTLELRIRGLEENLEQHSERDVPSVAGASDLEQANSVLLAQLKALAQQHEAMERDFVVAKDSLQPLQAELGESTAKLASLQQELELLRKDREQWKSHASGSEVVDVQEKLGQSEAKLAASEAQAERLRQEFVTKLKQERALRTAVQSQVDALTAKVGELGAKVGAQDGDARDSRIAHLENEINRISDEFTEEEQRKKTLEGQLAEAAAKLQAAEAARAQAEDDTAAAKAQAEQAQAAQAALAEQAAQAAQATAPGIELEETETGENEQLKALMASLAAAANEADVEKLRSLVSDETKNRLKAKTQTLIQSRIDALKNQLVEETEERVKKKFELKNKITQQKCEKLAAYNEELKLTVRKLKGGEAVNVVTMPDGTTRPADLVPAQAPSGPQAQAQNQARNKQRPAVNRNGSKGNKRNSSGDDQNLSKRLREG